MGVFPKLENRLDFSSIGDDDEALTRLHYILFGNNGSRSGRKRQIGLWRPGSSESDIKRQQIKRELAETLGTVLKEICVILGAEIGSNRSENEEIILRLLTERPMSSSVGTPKPKPAPVLSAPIKSEPAAPPSLKSPKKGAKKLPGRKKGGKNNPEYQAEYEAGTRRRPGRPRQIDEHRALIEFLKKNHSDVFTEWQQMEPWVKEMYDAGLWISRSQEERNESPKKRDQREESEASPVRLTESGAPVRSAENKAPVRVPENKAAVRSTDKKAPESKAQKTITMYPVVPEIVKRGRGRPRKIVRGRPKKNEAVEGPVEVSPRAPERSRGSPEQSGEIRKRGRPKKVGLTRNKREDTVIVAPEVIKRGRGRPKKISTASVVVPTEIKRGPGRPRKYF